MEVGRNGRTVSMKEMGSLRLFLKILIVLHLLHFSISCPVLGEHAFGDITGDQNLEVGELLRLRCSLFPEQAEKINVSVENLILKFQGKVLTDIRSVDDLTIEYVVESVIVNDTGYYSCFVEHPDYNAKQLVCSSYIAVGYKPLEVEEFSCISLEYTNLTCKWRAPHNPVDTQYRLYDYYFRPTVNRSCPVVLNSSSCQFRVDTEPVYVKNAPKLHFILVGTNPLGVNKQFIDVDHYKIVKPGVPKFMICSNVTKNSLFMRWNAPKGLDYGEAPAGLLYHLKYYSVSTKLPHTKEIIKYAEKDLLITIENLVPNTIYTFEIRVRLNISGNDYYWSEVAKHTEKTESDVPYLAPEITNSAFDFQIIAGNRSITLYWKAIASEFENGENFHYLIRYHVHHIPFRYRREVPGVANNWVTLQNKTSYTFEYMDTDSAYIFNIVAVNKVGNSTNESSIVVDKIEKLLQGPKDITVVSYGLGNYSLSWKDPNEETTHFTLFWCQTLKSRPAKCDGPIEWLHTTKNTHELLLSDHHTNYQFAVAANYNHQTSGMMWAPCIALYSGVRYKVSEMKLMPRNSTSLRVQWSLGCRAQEKVIQKYLISFCPYEGKCIDNNWKCEVGWSNVTIMDPSANEYILGALKPYTCYFSFIRVLTNSGWSENSDYAYESTMQSAPDDPPRHIIATPIPVTPYSVEIDLLFDAPITPNGVITKYRIYYNSSEAFEMEVRAKEGSAKSEGGGRYQVRIKNFVHYYTNYSVEVAACVNEACSDLSSPVYVYTGISNPSVVSAPRVELSDSFVNITWEVPSRPNGPIDFYEVELYSNFTDKSMHYAVNSSSSLTLKRECNSVSPDEKVYDFRVRAVNVDGDAYLYGDYSRPTKMVFCPSGTNIGFYAGVVAGSLVILVVVVAALSFCIHKCRGEYLSQKNINIKLPLELETPFGNPLTSFDKLKNGLQKTAPDASIPSDRAYERLCSFAQEGNPCDPNRWAETDGASHRNNSGESNKSGLSSADTTRTLVSMDSSAEQAESESSDHSHLEGSDIPPMNDMDPLSLIPQIVTQNADNMTFSRCFVRPRMPTIPLIRYDDLGIMSAYSRFSEIPSTSGRFDTNRSPAEQDSQFQSRFSPDTFLENLYKINSEPSLYVSDDDDTEPPSPSLMQPYSKVGLARSTTHLGESNRRNVGYSRFGGIFKPNNGQNNPQIFTVFVPPSAHQPYLPSTFRNKNTIPTVGGKDSKVKNPAIISKDAYSKFGVCAPAFNSNGKNYVALSDLHEKGVVPSVSTNGWTFDSKVNGYSCSPPVRTGRTENDLPEANPSHLGEAKQEMPEEDDDPRSLQEIIAADARFATTEKLPNILGTCSGTHFFIAENKFQNCNGIDGAAHLPNGDSRSAPVANDVEHVGGSDLWNGFNGSDLPVRPLNVEDYDEEDFNTHTEHENIRVNPSLNNYLALSELAKRDMISTNSIVHTKLVDTPVASI